MLKLKILTICTIFFSKLIACKEDVNSFFLLVSNSHYGSIEIPKINAGILEFKEKIKNCFIFNKYIKQFEDIQITDSFFRKIPLSNIIMISMNDKNNIQLFNTKDFSNSYDIESGFSGISVKKNNPNDAIVAYVNEGRCSVVEYNTLTKEKRNVDNVEWLRTVGYNLFEIKNQQLICSLWGMDKTPILTLDEIDIPKNSTHFALYSAGENYMYFNIRYGFNESKSYVVYDVTNKKWQNFELTSIAHKISPFGDCIALKGNNGIWDIVINGQIQSIFLGIDSKVLYLDNKSLIFNNDCRLYKCLVKNSFLKKKSIIKIAEHDYIRYGEALFFN